MKRFCAEFLRFDLQHEFLVVPLLSCSTAIKILYRSLVVCRRAVGYASYYLPCFCDNSASESLDFKPPMLVSNSEVSSHTLKECCEQQFGTPSGAKIKLCRWGGGQSIPEPGKDGKDVQKSEIPSIYWLVVSTCQRGSICLYFFAFHPKWEDDPTDKFFRDVEKPATTGNHYNHYMCLGICSFGWCFQGARLLNT